MKILIADPAKNITVFVLDPVDDPAERRALAREILSEKGLGAEQLGFVFPPGSCGPKGRISALWHLEMAGGEFCGNAGRSFALYIALLQGLKGKTKVFVSVSGAEGPVPVEVDTEKGRAAAEMPKPQFFETLDYEGRPLPALIFEGITHVIAPDLEADSKTFYRIKSLAEKKLSAFPALGVMFYDTASRFLRPAVYVINAGSLVFESSCGSGSAALGVWLSRKSGDGTASYDLSQPGGVIETAVTRKAGVVTGINIGGEVKLEEPQEFPWPVRTTKIKTPSNTLFH